MITAGLIGFGNRGREHAAALALIPGVKLIAIADPDEDGRRAAGALPGMDVFSGAREMLESQLLDYVIIATPPVARTDTLLRTILAFPQVRTVLAEKPLALSAPDAAAWLEGCAASGVTLHVGYHMRHCLEFLALRDAVAAGLLGKIEVIEAGCFGNLFNQGCHMVDLAAWLLNEEPIAGVTARTSHALNELVAKGPPLPPFFEEDRAHPAPFHTEADFVFGRGARLHLQSGVAAPRPVATLDPWLQERLRVTGSAGTAEAHVASHFQRWDSAGALVEDRRSSLAQYLDATVALHRRILESLSMGQQSATPPPGTVLGVQRALDACFISAIHDGGPVSLSKSSSLEDPRSAWQNHLQRESAARRAAHAASPPPRLSIVLPMEDHRGFGVACVTAWTRGQTHDAADFELVVVLNERTESLRGALVPLLRPWDRLVHAPRETSGHSGLTDEIAEYDLAIRESRGVFVFLTEPHCVAEPEAVAEILRWFDENDGDGFCTRTMPVIPNAIGAMESHYYDAGFKEWQRPCDWRKLILRGVALRRQHYDAVGGFRVRYGRFAEWLLAADLKRRGHQLGYAPRVVLAHLYADSFHLLDQFIRAFTEGECLYRLENETSDDDPYFPNPAEWTTVRHFNASATKACLRVALRHVFRAGLRSVGNLLLSTLLGRRLLAWQIQSRVWQAKIRAQIWRWLDRRRMYCAFVDYYEGQTILCRVRYCLKHTPPSSGRIVAKHNRVLPAEMPGHELFGFNGRETASGKSFRWSQPIAALLIHPLHSSTHVELRLHPLMPPVHFARDLVVCWAGQRLRFLGQRGLTLQFEIPPGTRWRAPGWLVLCTPRFRSTGDDRALGIPLHAVRFLKARGNSLEFKREIVSVLGADVIGRAGREQTKV